jgi:hypothetical protein
MTHITQPKAPFTLYVDRNPNSIEGRLTLQPDVTQIKANTLIDDNTPFIRLPIRSGQKGYEGTSWVRGKSPIPFGQFRLWLQPLSRGVLPGKTGIGEFYPISSSVKDKRLLQHTHNKHFIRQDIGLHRENALPGSAGCVVLVANTPEESRLIDRLFDFLTQLGKSFEWLPVIVL